MAPVIVLALLAVVAAPLASAMSPEAKKVISARLENVDVDKILNNNRVLNNYVKCLLDKGPCTPEAKDLKKILPEMMEEIPACTDCTPKLKSTMQKTINALRKKHPKEWEVLYKKYDPKRERINNLEEFLRS